ncbi:MAG: hypothetical protein HUJ78_06345, partial [Mogibacterium sp.]|nr:hypothetical protein [Mogibacterium sp.]
MNRHRYSIILVYILAIVMCLSTTNIAFATESVTEPAKADSVTEEANAGEEELTKDENTESAEKEKSNAKNEETVNSAESTEAAEISVAAASEEKVSAAASYTDSNLNNFVNSFTLENLTSGKQIPLSPKPSVNTQDEYLFTMKFVEVADGKQFANVCTYTLPAGLNLTMNLNQDIRLKDGTKVATATGTKNQPTITVTFLNNWPSDSLESQMEFAFHAMFNSTSSNNNFTVDLGNNVTCVVDLSVGASLDVQKTAEKVGATDQVFDAANHTIKYSVTVTANGAVNNAKFTDTYSNNMTLQKATVKVNGVTATATDFTPSDTTKRGFEIDLGNMQSGDQKVVTYTMKADDSVLFANGGYTVHSFDNKAKVEGTVGGNTISDEDTKTVTHAQNNFNKWTSDVTGNDKQISWTVAIGDNTYNDGLDLRGKTVQDTLGPDHQLVTTLPSGWNGPIKVTYSTRAANGTVTNNNVAYYNSLNNITFPNTADPIVYATINYKTECDSATFPAVGSKDYRNTAEININSGWKAVKDATKQGAGIPGISKKIVDAGQPGGKMSFEVVVDVPAGADTLQYFYLGDVFNIMNGFADNTQVTDITAYENLVIKVGGQTLVEGTDYTVAANKNIYFGSTQKATSKWPYSTAQQMVITYDVTRTNAATAPSASGYTYTTIDGALDAGLSLRNTATIGYKSNGSAEATKTSTVYYAEKTTPSMEKKAVNIDTAKHTIDYEVTIDPKLFPNSGTNTNFTFKDTFDGRLEYVAGTLQ